MKKVFVLYCNEDGEHSLDTMEEAEFLEKLNQNYWGANPLFGNAELGINLDTFSGLVVFRDCLIPKAVQAVTKYKL